MGRLSDSKNKNHVLYAMFSCYTLTLNLTHGMAGNAYSVATARLSSGVKYSLVWESDNYTS